MNTENIREQIQQYTAEAEKAKRELNFEYAFLLLDRVSSLENQLESLQLT